MAFVPSLALRQAGRVWASVMLNVDFGARRYTMKQRLLCTQGIKCPLSLTQLLTPPVLLSSRRRGGRGGAGGAPLQSRPGHQHGATGAVCRARQREVGMSCQTNACKADLAASMVQARVASPSCLQHALVLVLLYYVDITWGATDSGCAAAAPAGSAAAHAAINPSPCCNQRFPMLHSTLPHAAVNPSPCTTGHRDDGAGGHHGPALCPQGGPACG